VWSQVCGSMPYDDTDMKKMIKYQTERKVGFSRHKKISDDVKQLIHGILEAKTEQRFSISDIRESNWMTQSEDSSTTSCSTPMTTRPATSSRVVEALPTSGQQTDSTSPVTIAASERVMDEFDHRRTISVNNNNDIITKQHHRLAVPSANHGAGATVLHRQLAGGHRMADGGSQTVPRSAARRREDPSRQQHASQLWSPAVVVRDRVRGSGR